MLDLLCRPKVRQFADAVRIHQHIRALDVSVQNATASNKALAKYEASHGDSLSATQRTPQAVCVGR